MNDEINANGQQYRMRRRWYRTVLLFAAAVQQEAPVSEPAQALVPSRGQVPVRAEFLFVRLQYD